MLLSTLYAPRAARAVALTVGLLFGLSSLGCRTPAPAPPSLALEALPAPLAEPATFDWASQRVSGARLSVRRAESMQRRVQAFTAPTGWSAAGEPLSTQFTGVAAADTVPNGPASVYTTLGTPTPAANTTMFLTKAGMFLRVSQNKTQRHVLNLGKTFSRTYVSVSPAGGRAYALSDDGTFFVVNTGVTPMTFQSFALGVANCAGLAPVYDPYVSAADDARDEVYVPTADGRVRHYRVTRGASAAVAPVVGTPTVYNVTAGAATQSPPIVLGGVIYQGDSSGKLTAYDTNANVGQSYTVGAPINAAPALEINDFGTPIHAFVNAGSGAAWVNLVTGTIVFSRPLFLDDGETASVQQGYLLDYDYQNNPNTYNLPVKDALTVNTQAGPVNLPGVGNYKTASELTPAETNMTGAANNPTGGPAVAYMRWDNTSGTVPSSEIIQKALLMLKTNASNDNNNFCPPVDVRATDHKFKGGGGIWSSAGMDLSNRPDVGPVDISQYIGTLNNKGNVKFSVGSYYSWDVTSAFANAPAAHFALALQYSASQDIVCWPSGPNQNFAPGNSFGFKKAPRFFNNIADQSTITNFNPNTESRPVLQVSTSKATMPTAAIETPPIIDALRKRIYVFYTNAVFSLSYGAEDQFTDTNYDAANSLGAKYTTFAVTRAGNRTINAATYGGTFASQTRFVGNMTAPLLSFDLGSLYVLDRYPTAVTGTTPTTYRYSLNKIALPITGTVSTTAVTNFQEFTGIPAASEAGAYMTMDFFGGAAAGNHLHFGLASGANRIFQLNP